MKAVLCTTMNNLIYCCFLSDSSLISLFYWEQVLFCGQQADLFCLQSDLLLISLFFIENEYCWGDSNLVCRCYCLYCWKITRLSRKKNWCAAASCSVVPRLFHSKKAIHFADNALFYGCLSCFFMEMGAVLLFIDLFSYRQSILAENEDGQTLPCAILLSPTHLGWNRSGWARLCVVWLLQLDLAVWIMSYSSLKAFLD